MFGECLIGPNSLTLKTLSTFVQAFKIEIELTAELIETFDRRRVLKKRTAKCFQTRFNVFHNLDLRGPEFFGFDQKQSRCVGLRILLLLLYF